MVIVLQITNNLDGSHVVRLLGAVLGPNDPGSYQTVFLLLQVGGFCLMYKEDMKRVAPLWLKYSRAVRHDPDVSFCLAPLRRHPSALALSAQVAMAKAP